MSQQSSCALSTAGRHHPGMVGDIISERWAASNRNAGRHHVGILGGFARNPRDIARRHLALNSVPAATTNHLTQQLM